jgi:DNA-binding transcriptional regulator YhcF (GntR family)
VNEVSWGESASWPQNVPTDRPTAPARRLLGTMLNSFEKLEITIALHRAATRMLSVHELTAKLGLSSHVVERGIDELVRAGMVELASDVARLTLDPQDIPAMDEIAALYDEDRLLVVRKLTEISMEKMRGMAARAFADAFQLRKKKEEDGDA